MVRDLEEVDRDVLATSEDENSVQGEENAQEQEPVADEDEEGSEYYLYRLDRLLRLDERDELPTLDPQSAFGRTAIDRSALPISKEDFYSRLKYFLETEGPNIPPLSSELANFLFNRGVNAHRHIAADFVVNNTKSPELDRARRYLRQELNRYIKIRSLLAEKRQKTPNWMSAWAQCWIGAFEEIQEEIEAQLRGATKTVDNLSQVRISGRFEMKSHILWMEKKEIRKQIANTSVARKLEVILAAFAYAAKLMPEPSSGIAGYVALIKPRVSRVSRSPRKHAEAYLFFLRTYLAMLGGNPVRRRVPNLQLQQ